MREMDGKYVGNRPIKLRKSNWKDRNFDVVKKKQKQKAKLGLWGWYVVCLLLLTFHYEVEQILIPLPFGPPFGLWKSLELLIRCWLVLNKYAVKEGIWSKIGDCFVRLLSFDHQCCLDAARWCSACYTNAGQCELSSSALKCGRVYSAVYKYFSSTVWITTVQRVCENSMRVIIFCCQGFQSIRRAPLAGTIRIMRFFRTICYMEVLASVLSSVYWFSVEILRILFWEFILVFIDSVFRRRFRERITVWPLSLRILHVESLIAECSSYC